MIASEPAAALALAGAVGAPARARPAGRAWAGAVRAPPALALALPALAVAWPGAPSGRHWNWAGQALALLATLAMAALLVRRAGMSWREMGFTWRQQRGSVRAALAVSAAVLGAHYASTRAVASLLPALSLQTWLYQATLPGLVEEVLLRGVLLALLDRAFAARRRWLGVSWGWGAMVVTAVFVALHGVRPVALASALVAGLLFVWLRQRTGSLVLPVVVHNLWNLVVVAAHR